MIKNLSRFCFIALLSAALSTALAQGDSCLNMMKAHWRGQFTTEYRGDKNTFPAMVTTQYLRPHHYSMTLEERGRTIVFTGTCNANSAIYFENFDKPSPYYLSGITNGGTITLSGHHGPDVVSISLSRQ